MARLTVSLALLLTGLTTHAARADSTPDDDTLAAAAQAGVAVADLDAALHTLADAGLPTDPFSYLRAEGALPAPVARPVAAPGCDWPICGPLGARLLCIERLESNHGAQMYNRTPVWNGEHAQGWLGFLPSTARAWGVRIGDRASEWAGAAHMLSTNAGRQFYGIAAGIC